MKASLAFTLLQWAQKKFHRWLLSIAIAIDTSICLATVLYFLLQCQPVSYAWRLIDPTVKGHCLPFSGQIIVGFALSGTTVSLDLLFLFTPFWMLAGREVNPRLKLFIYGIFGLGVIASIANFLRLGTLVVLKKSTDPLCKSLPLLLFFSVANSSTQSMQLQSSSGQPWKSVLEFVQRVSLSSDP